MRDMQHVMSGKVQGLRVVVFWEDGYWVAQCIEHDIGAQGRTIRDMAVHFALTMGLDRAESIERHGKPYAGIDPAPSYFERLWEKRAGALTPIQTIGEESSEYEMALVA